MLNFLTEIQLDKDLFYKAHLEYGVLTWPGEIDLAPDAITWCCNRGTIMLVGYARISTVEQNLDLQITALREVDCEKLYQDQISGTKANRPGLSMALEILRKNDTLVVWNLDRLGRNKCRRLHIIC